MTVLAGRTGYIKRGEVGIRLDGSSAPPHLVHYNMAPGGCCTTATTHTSYKKVTRISKR